MLSFCELFWSMIVYILSKFCIEFFTNLANAFLSGVRMHPIGQQDRGVGTPAIDPYSSSRKASMIERAILQYYPAYRA